MCVLPSSINGCLVVLSPDIPSTSWWSFCGEQQWSGDEVSKKREPQSQYLLTGMPQTCPPCTILSCPRRSRGRMPPSSGLIFMRLGFMQRLTTLPTCQSTKICQRCQENRVPFPASHVLAVWRTRTCWCPRKSYSFGIGNLELGCNVYKQWCGIESLRIHLADCSVIHPS